MENHTDIFKIIGLNVKAYRKKAGLTQQELADKFSGDRAKISDIEHGKEDFMLSTILNIADGLNVDVKELFILKKKE